MANTKSKKRNRIILVVALALIAGGVVGWIYWRKREKPIVVQTEKAARRNLTELVVATGKIQPVVQVIINPEVSGEIVELPVKEGDHVTKGDLLVRIKPDNYIAQRNSAEANHRSALANSNLAKANLDKAKLEFSRINQLFENKLVSDSQFLEIKTTLAVMEASYETSTHQAEMAKASLARAEDDLAKTTIKAPIDGTVTKLKVERGERVVGTAMMAGTEIMTVAKLDEMEARVDIGEVDVVLIALNQKARLEVDSFRDRKFNGVVTEIANAAKTSGLNTQQEATKFEVKIRIYEKEAFRPGMSVTAEVETRYRTNVLTVPIQSVTMRLPKELEAAKKGKNNQVAKEEEPGDGVVKKGNKQGPKSEEVVFEIRGVRAYRLNVKRGISDNDFVEILEGVNEGQEIVSGGYKAINRELEEGKWVKVDNKKKAPPTAESK
ncbi:MAG: efflux RND transporter periplasmic adaptor subunit [Verrucomicrobiales bacterium]|nr:efflux RND transporter periplasmic adaptor subunit [Verrucomicrobiales bacterium]